MCPDSNHLGGQAEFSEPGGQGETERRQRLLNLRSTDDLAYLDAMTDMAPRLTSRADMSDPLTDMWRLVVKKLVADHRALLAEMRVSHD